jgi:hypothetical protein
VLLPSIPAVGTRGDRRRRNTSPRWIPNESALTYKLHALVLASMLERFGGHQMNQARQPLLLSVSFLHFFEQTRTGIILTSIFFSADFVIDYVIYDVNLTH